MAFGLGRFRSQFTTERSLKFEKKRKLAYGIAQGAALADLDNRTNQALEGAKAALRLTDVSRQASVPGRQARGQQFAPTTSMFGQGRQASPEGVFTDSRAAIRTPQAANTEIRRLTDIGMDFADQDVQEYVTHLNTIIEGKAPAVHGQEPSFLRLPGGVDLSLADTAAIVGTAGIGSGGVLKNVGATIGGEVAGRGTQRGLEAAGAPPGVVIPASIAAGLAGGVGGFAGAGAVERRLGRGLAEQGGVSGVGRRLATEERGGVGDANRFKKPTPEGVLLEDHIPATSEINRGLTRVQDDIAAVDAKITALKGKKGVTGARKQMEDLQIERGRLMAQDELDRITASGDPMDAQFAQIEGLQKEARRSLDELQGIRDEGTAVRESYGESRSLGIQKAIRSGWDVPDRSTLGGAPLPESRRRTGPQGRGRREYDALEAAEFETLGRERAITNFLDEVRVTPVEDPTVGRRDLFGNERPTFATEAELQGYRASQGAMFEGQGPGGAMSTESAGPLFADPADKLREKLQPWRGKAYRVDTGFKPGGTAGGVVRFETQELGNEMGIADDVLAELDNYPADAARWVTKTKKDAMRYGAADEVGEETFGPEARILAEDGDGGYLVFDPPDVPRNVAPNVPPQPTGATSAAIARDVQPNVARIDEELVGSSHGQKDLTLTARDAEGRQIGYLNYSTYQGDVQIQGIEVAEQARRQGIGRALFNDLQSRYPDQKIDWGMTTPAGTALRNAVDPGGRGGLDYAPTPPKEPDLGGFTRPTQGEPLAGGPPSGRPPAPPQEPPRGREPPAGPGEPPSWRGAADKIVASLDSLRSKFREVEVLRSGERSKRAGAALGALRGGGTPEQRILRSRGQLKGKYDTLNLDEVKLTPEEGQALIGRIADWGVQTGRAFEPQTGYDAVLKITNGVPPAPHEIDILEEIFGSPFAESLRLAVRGGKGSPLWNAFVETAVIPKSILSSFDVSYPFRQGIKVAVRHNKEFRGNIPGMLRAFASEDTAQTIQRSILEDSTPITLKTADGQEAVFKFGDVAQTMGIVRPLGGVGSRAAQEEGFVSRTVQNWPGVKHSARAFTTYGNKLRADITRYWLGRWVKNGTEITPQRIAEMGKLMNALTGRASIGKGPVANRMLELLQATWWSPQYRLSTPQTLATLFDPRTDAAVRRIAAENMVGYVAGGLGVLALASQLPDAVVEVDPRSTDFGKIRLGDLRVNFWGTDQLLARTIAQITTGQRKDPEMGIGPTSRKDPMLRYFRSGLAPEWGAVWDVIEGKNYLGDPLLPSAERGITTEDIAKREAVDRLAPLALKEIYQAAKTEGVRGFLIASALAPVGVGVSAYKQTASNQLQEIPEFYNPEWGEDNPTVQDIGQMRDLQEEVRVAADKLLETEDIPPGEFDWELLTEDVGKEKGYPDKVIELAQFMRSNKSRDENRNPEWIKFVVEHADDLRRGGYSRLMPGNVPNYISEAIREREPVGAR